MVSVPVIPKEGGVVSVPVSPKEGGVVSVPVNLSKEVMFSVPVSLTEGGVVLRAVRVIYTRILIILYNPWQAVFISSE